MSDEAGPTPDPPPAGKRGGNAGNARVRDIKNKTGGTCCGARTLRAASTILSMPVRRPQECGRGKHECLRHRTARVLGSRTLRLCCDFNYLNPGATSAWHTRNAHAERLPAVYLLR